MIEKVKDLTGFLNSRNSIFISLFLILCTAFFSEGFLHPDEHYQILELVNLKRDNAYVDLSIFNWDYWLQIRPWFQSWLYYFLLMPFSYLDPFKQAFIIRLFNGLLGFYALYRLFSFHQFKDKGQRLLFLTLIWFVPFFLVRTNSESLSTTFFIFAIPYFLKEDKNLKHKNMMISGFFFGLSFLVRYQMGIAILFVNLWKLIKKKDFLSFFVCSLFIIATCSLGFIFDYFGYEEFVFAPYNYFRENIINKRASEFGTDPFYYYLIRPIVVGGPFLTLPILYSLIVYLKKNKINFYVTAFISYLLVHSFIAHKEVRFLILNYILAAICFCIYAYPKILKTNWLKIVFVLNLIFLFKFSTTSISKEILLYKVLYKHSFNQVLHLTDKKEGYLFSMPFYQRQKIKTILDDRISYPIVLTTKYNEYLEYKTQLKNCEVIFQTYPNWVTHFNYFGWLERSAYFKLFKCPL